MKDTIVKKNKTIKTTAIASLLALTLVATAPLTGLAGSGFASAQDLQQNRIIAHAMSHKNKKFAKIKDRNEGIKITAGYAWCAWFIEHCSYECKLGSIIPSKSADDFAVGPLSRDLVNKKGATINFVNKKMYNKRKADYEESRTVFNKSYQPRKGDIVVYGNWEVTGSYYLSHVGFVYEDCENALTGVKTIEGNTMGKDPGWEKTSKVGVRENADDTNPERRIVAYITPKYCQHAKVNKTTGQCSGKYCKADYFYFDNPDTLCATDEEAGLTYSIEASKESPVKILVYPYKKANVRKTFKKNRDITVLGSVNKGLWYKVTYIGTDGTQKYGYVKVSQLIKHQGETETDITNDLEAR